MKKTLHPLRHTLFLLAALAFLLPFVKFSCAGTEVANVKGHELALGTEIRDRHGKRKELEAEPLAMAALISAGLGLLFGLTRGRAACALAAVTGAAGAVLLFFLPAKLDHDLSWAGLQGMPLGMSMEPGYWLAMAAFTGGAVAHAAQATDPRSLATPETQAPVPSNPENPGRARLAAADPARLAVPAPRRA
ncbi:MAG: hypothetical protein HY720_01635 [Planctomycetes bacterium]|nr:hypothetical protein [Planctomycetota bacterium]